MKSFSFKVLYISIFAPSLLFVLTLPLLENVLQRDLAADIHGGLIQGHAEVIEGKVSLYAEINNNITQTIRRNLAVRLGAEPRVRVQDADGNILFPFYDHLLRSLQTGEPQELAAGALFDNLGFLTRNADEPLEQLLRRYSDFLAGLRIDTRISIPVTSWLGTITLIAYILLTCTALYLYYQRSSRLEEKNLQELTTAMRRKLEQEKQDYATQLDNRLQEAQARLAEIKHQEEEWLLEVERLEKEKTGLEEELLETLGQSEAQQEKLHQLEEEVARQSEQQARADAKTAETLTERFTRLYRNLEFDPAAIKGLVHLRDSKAMLQAEEILKRLNDNDPGLKIRRKIAGVEDCEAFELGFGAKGRIYYVRSQSRQYRVARIGTKTTQAKDLAALKGI